ncbi:carboxypeptidase-like regulatory domain-containing protein [Marinifilum sp.]|uniref:carboxypeptidase-like regulatory domain-containing protein n=1 Tax=Marinifilum sp. TaxID=2033137 RepID=UPI003BABFA52
MKPKLRWTYEYFLSYFANKMSGKEKHAFEKSVMQDDFENDAFDGISKLSSLEFQQDVKELKLSLESITKQKLKKRLQWMYYAASIVLILGLSFVLYYINQTQNANEFVSQDIESHKPESELTAADTIVMIPKTKQLKKEESSDRQMLKNDVEFEITDIELNEEMEKDFLVVLDMEEVEGVEKIQAMETAKNERLMVPVEMKDQKKEALAKSKKVLEVLEGKAAGVMMSNTASNIHTRGVSNIRSDENDRKITGLVVDENKTPIPGVAIHLKGTTQGTISDFDGKFVMKLTDTDISSDYKLRASFVGFETKEMDLADSLLVVLEQDHPSLSEVVVTGYGSSQDQQGKSSWQKAKPLTSKNLREYKRKLIAELKSAKGIEGKHKIRVEFDLSKNAVIKNIVIKGSNNSILINQIKSSILKSTWIPAKRNDLAIDSKLQFTVRINFN